MAALVKDLQAHKGAALVIPGDNQPAAVHALAHAMNQALGAVGNTVIYTDPVEAKPQDQTAALKELVGDMNAGKVDLLLIVGGNPVYDAPADLKFAEAMDKVQLRVQHSAYQNETTDHVHWHINATHYLEQWGDVRAIDGTATLIQPLIAPLYDGKSEYEFIEALIGSSATPGYEIVRKYWQAKLTGDFEPAWRKALHDGFMAGYGFPGESGGGEGQRARGEREQHRSAGGDVPARSDDLRRNVRQQRVAAGDSQADDADLLGQRDADQSEDREIAWPEDGRHRRDRGEWPQGERRDLAYAGTSGQLGHRVPGLRAHARPDAWGTSVGFNGYTLRASDGMNYAAGKMTKVGDSYGFANPQGWQYIDQSGIPGAEDMSDRHIVRKATLEDFIKNPDFAQGAGRGAGARVFAVHHERWMPIYKYTEAKWGMAIDMNSCIGCKTCVVACQAENNIPVVGKEQVKRGRHMNWLRVDVYYEGGTENPSAYYQPIPCQQCENAPCEVVCPVGATVHSTEGLNDMVYNRCVGTRYCSNNCPYKVRRFNFLLWQDWDTPQYKMMRNPEVSVRSRGVMEKCTYCVQRITPGRITAEKENRAGARRRSHHGLPAGVPGGCDHIRQPERSRTARWRS